MVMSARSRLMAILQGETIDRPALFTQIPFGLSEPKDSKTPEFIPAPFHGYVDYDDWRKQDPAYWRLVKRMETETDNFFIWRPPCMQNNQFFLPPSAGITTKETGSDGKVYFTTEYSIAGTVYREISAKQPGSGHSWQIEHLCKTPSEAETLLTLPWNGYESETGDFFSLQDRLGERGLMWVTIPSPLQVVTRLFDPNEFLVLSRLESKLIYRLMETATERIYKNLEKLLHLGAGPIIRFGGAEHATPPLMSPADFDNLVVNFDTPLVNLCKKQGRLVAYHCHGKITHALQRFIEMGVDMTDPVETVPDGDMTLKQAKEIAGDALTLIGNIQMRDIAASSPDTVKTKVQSIIETLGPDHFIVSTTGTPLQKIDSRTESNYHAVIDAVNS